MSNPLLRLILPAIVPLCLWGCGSGSEAGLGDVSIALTDAASDELEAFEVDVTALSLTKLDGTIVNLLPRSTRVDFVALQSVSELVVAGSLETGLYTRMAMTLDFTNATISIVGQTTPASVVDKNGVPITGTFDVVVDFAVGARPVVRAGRNHLYQLDLDLDQGVTVDSGANRVTFCPVLSAVVDPELPKPVATTGILNAVDTVASTFTVERRALDGNPLAEFTVRTSFATVFQIDGVVSVGAPGLAALSLLGLGADRVWVQGTLDPAQRVLRALAVEAGNGVFGNGQSWVLGHVVARDFGAGVPAALTVLGRSLDAGGPTRRFNTLHTVDVAPGTTRVLRRGAGNTLSSDAIAPGQLVLAFGDMTGTTLDTTTGPGVVRLLRTDIFGIAAGPASGGQLTVDVVRFGLRPVGQFSFLVGGNPESDPLNYTVDTGTLDTTGITSGSRLRMAGFVNPVGVIGDADATAVALTDHTDGAKVLLVQWTTANPTAVTATSASSITLDVGAAPLRVVGDGFAPVTVTPSPAPVIAPLLAVGIYRIVEDGGVQVHFGFDSFRQALATRLATIGSPGSTVNGVFRVAAFGTFDPGTQLFGGLTVTFVLD